MAESLSRPDSSNVRWDEVVDRALVEGVGTPIYKGLWEQRDKSTSELHVHVQLFGAWASVTYERTLNLVVPRPATVGAVIAAMGERLGDAFLAYVLDENGAKRRYCRLAVNGIAVDDVRTPIDSDAIEVEMILLVGTEGG